MPAAKPYPYSAVIRRELLLSALQYRLIQELKAGTSATGKYIIDINSTTLLKIRVNTSIPTLGTFRAIADLYLSYT